MLARARCILHSRSHSTLQIADGMTLVVGVVNLLIEPRGGAQGQGGATWASPLASITIRNMSLYTTNENWQVVSLKEARDFSNNKKYIYVFKKLEWASLSIDLLPHPDMFIDADMMGSKNGVKRDGDGAKRVFFGGERFLEGISGQITIQRTDLNSPLGLEVQLHITEALCPALSEPGLRALLRFMTGVYVCLNRGDVDPAAKQRSVEAAGCSLVSIAVDHIFLCIKDADFRLELLMQSLFFSRSHNVHSMGAEGWLRTFFSFLVSCIPGIISPHARVVQKWNKVYKISLMVAIFQDPLFVFLLSVNQEFRCINFDLTLGRTMAVLRSITDCLFLVHMLLQFRLAYVDSGSRAVGTGELVDKPKKIFLRYLYGYFSMDVLAVFPLFQIIVLGGLSSVYNSINSWLETILLLQSGFRLYRFTLLVTATHTLHMFMRATASGNYLLNVCFCGMYTQLVGSCWYLFGIQRMKECLRSACAMSNMTYKDCKTFIECGSGKKNLLDNFANNWRDVSSNCFEKNLFNFGIYKEVTEVSHNHFITKWAYSFFWGLQQISTMAGNQTPSYYLWEILFSIWVVGTGLICFAILVGNIQSFIQALGRRELDIKLKRMDTEHWMRRRRLPEELRREVRQSEKFHYDATDGVDEELLLKNLPENLQREIRRHRFSFIKKVRIFAQMDDQILDAICERLKQNLCIKGSKILNSGGVIDKMHFIVWGKMISVDTNGNRSLLSEGDVCGEELLTCCLDNYSEKEAGGKLCISRQYLPSNRTVTCLTNVEAFSLQLTDLDEVITLFPGFLRNSRVQGALRYESPYWRLLAATRIQIAWRYKKKRLTRAKISNPGTNNASR